MKNNKLILSCIITSCMMLFCLNGVFAQGATGQYPGAGIGFDSGCGYGNAVIPAVPGSVNPGIVEMLTGGCGNTYTLTATGLVETATGFDIAGFELNNYDIDDNSAYGFRIFYGPQDNCGTICLDAFLDISQNAACGTFGPQNDLGLSFGYPVPANYGNDIFGEDVIPYANMCPNTEYFIQIQHVLASSALPTDLTDPDGNGCALNDGLITQVGTTISTGTIVAPGTRSSFVINAATFTPTAPVACADDEVVFDLTVDVTSGCETSFGPISKGLEVEVRADIACGADPNIQLTSGPLIMDPTACLVGVVGTDEVPDQLAAPIQVAFSEAQLCAILACDPNAMLEIYAYHTFCEADDINGDGSGVDEAIFMVSVAAVLGELETAMCCEVACPEFNAITVAAGCAVYDICIGYADTDQDGIGDNGEDPTGTTMTVDVGGATGGTAINDGVFLFGGNAVGYCFTYEYFEQGCDPVPYPGTVTVTCPDGTPGVLNLSATGGPIVTLTGADVVGDVFGVAGGGAFYPVLTANTTPAVCPTMADESDAVAAFTEITAPDATVCATVTGAAPTCSGTGGDAATVIQANPITDPLLTALFGADPTFPYFCTINETADHSFTCAACPIPGCTDACAPNFDPTADTDDGSCEAYDDTCNADCTAGPFGGTWDAATCACINETAPVNGCTDMTALNYDPAANCDDGSCSNAVPGCTDACAPNFDPAATTDDGTCEAYDDTCNADCTAGPFGGTWDAATCACINETAPVNGCTDMTALNYDPAANCDDGSCMPAVPGCTDPCDPAFDPASTDETLCQGYDDTCNADCTAGPFGGTWDAATCACINETAPVSGCTDPTANNFDPAANCDDGSCSNAVPGCTDPCAPNYDAAATTDDGTCEAYDDTCNADCTAGPFGGTWDAATCACINETAPVNGCTDPGADNYDAAANCDDGSCVTTEPFLVIEDPCNCSLGIDLNGDASDGNELAAEIVTISGGSGNYSIQAVSGLTQADGATPVATGTADITGNQVIAYIPAGSTYSITVEDTTTGETVMLMGGPCPPCVADIPTVGEWGLIILGLLMSITAIVGIRARREEEAMA